MQGEGEQVRSISVTLSLHATEDQTGFRAKMIEQATVAVAIFGYFSTVAANRSIAFHWRVT
jgi:hypothetical protein